MQRWPDASPKPSAGAFGRLDVLVNNAGINVPDRSWQRLTPGGVAQVINGNLTGAFYVTQVALGLMRAQRDGLIITTASWAGRLIGPVAGPAYIAAKHGMVAMSYSLNLEECANGIRSTVIFPGEVATPIMRNRPVPETPESLARMIPPQDIGELIAFLARQPKRVCTNEVVISPRHNRGYISTMRARPGAVQTAAERARRGYSLTFSSSTTRRTAGRANMRSLKAA